MRKNPATATPLLTPARLAYAILTVTIMIVGLFWAAGRWDWVGGWVYVAAIALGSAASEFAVWRRDPDVIRARARMGEGTKTWDKICLSLYAILYMTILVVGALDAGRYGWSDMPGWLMPVGVALVWLSQAALAWCMIVNRYFEKTVRLQTDRGHTVIWSGPYRYLRHPGYAAAIAGYIAGAPFILGSWWAFAPALATAIVLVVRTALEDRMLHAELAGYPDYAGPSATGWCPVSGSRWTNFRMPGQSSLIVAAPGDGPPAVRYPDLCRMPKRHHQRGAFA